MKTTIDYSDSPAANFDAVEDIRDYLGSRYNTVADFMKTIEDADQFRMACSLAGIEGLPVRAWYDHFHGQGSYEARRPH